MSARYFIDESGNSGDLVKTGKGFGYDGQPVFVLACVGIDDEEGLQDEINRLRSLHGLSAGELKSSSLIKKPKMALDLADYLRRVNAPVFIEVIDKRFVVCINMVEHHVLPPVDAEIDLAPDAMWIKNIFAEYLYEHAPESVIEGFIAACMSPTRDAVRASLGGLAGWLFGERARDEIAPAILQGVVEVLSDLDDVATGDGAYLHFLPNPDESKTGKPIWMLPSLSSFTNIYARINLLHRRQIGDVTIFHDEQFYFEHILRDGKISAEVLFKNGVRPVAPYADYEFEQQASLEFVRSGESVGIQVADMLAGFVMRHIKTGLAGSEPTKDGALKRVFDSLLGMTVPQLGIGINLVVPAGGMARRGVPWSK